MGISSLSAEAGGARCVRALALADCPRRLCGGTNGTKLGIMMSGLPLGNFGAPLLPWFDRESAA